MGNKSNIEWCDSTWSPVMGCDPISPGCRNCYALDMIGRFRGRKGWPDLAFNVQTFPDRLIQPLRWKKPRKIFVCSMSDLFHDDVPEIFILDVFSVMAENPRHTFIVLTKRPERMHEILTSPTVANDIWLKTSTGLSESKPIWPLPNVWLGVTAENQEQADLRIPILLQIPAKVKWVSVEPMLGPIDLSLYLQDWINQDEIDVDMGQVWTHGLDWVVCGGESGPCARTMRPDWVRSLRDQCQAAGAPFFFKQMMVDGKLTKMPLLDGKEYREYPEVQPCRIGEQRLAAVPLLTV